MKIAEKKLKIQKLVAMACSKAWEMGDKAPAHMSSEMQVKCDLKAEKIIEDTTDEILKVG